VKAVKIIIISAAFCFLAGIPSYSPVRAVVVKQVNLAEITGSAKYIFSGQCINRVLEYDKNIEREVWVFTFRVDRMIKGRPRPRFSVMLSKTLVDMKQVPTYAIGDEVVLFLHPESRLGFTSPVGLGQGKFSVLNWVEGAKTVVNGNNNRNLFKGLDTPQYRAVFMESSYPGRISGLVTQKSGPVDYDLFLALVKALNKK